jgi:hypothetical protein
VNGKMSRLDEEDELGGMVSAYLYCKTIYHWQINKDLIWLSS